MLALRSTILFSTLILSFFIAVTHSFKLHEDVNVQILGKPPQKRALKPHNPLPCPPDGHPKVVGLKDTGSSVGVLPYTAQMIKEGNAKHATNSSNIKLRGADATPVEQSTAKGFFNRLKSLTTLLKRVPKLSKRFNGKLRIWYNQAHVKVGTDQVASMLWNFLPTQLEVPFDVEDQIIATGDLSGCSVLIVASPFAIIMIHVWERRANENAEWLLNPTGEAQQRMDAEFIAKGWELLRWALVPFGGSQANGYNGWFPRSSTVVQVIGPAANPDYIGSDTTPNPWYTAGNFFNPLGFIYQPALNGLQMMAVNGLIPGRLFTQSRRDFYRRRYSNDIEHGMDDREFIVIKPMIMPNFEVWAITHFDDDQAVPLVRLA